MRLHDHPISTTSRAVMLLAADQGIPLDVQSVDRFSGEHLQPPFAAINPSQEVPVLEDGTFRLIGPRRDFVCSDSVIVAPQRGKTFAAL